jgi:AcrR family transcriptional regulator
MSTVGQARQLTRFREREKRILDVARRILVDRGFDALSMDAVADAVHWSKGTVYQHFKSKEDILLALMLESVERKAELFQKAALFRGRSRERAYAVGVANGLFERLYPEHLASFLLIQANASRARVSADSREKFETRDAGCHVIVTGIVRDAIASGDLAPPADIAPEDVTFAIWSMAFGTRFLLASGAPIVSHEAADPDRVVNRNLRLLLDGLGWRPLSSEWDYSATERRVLAEVFAEENAR